MREAGKTNGVISHRTQGTQQTEKLEEKKQAPSSSSPSSAAKDEEIPEWKPEAKFGSKGYAGAGKVGASTNVGATDGIDGVKSVSTKFVGETDMKERVAQWNTKGWKEDLKPMSKERLAELTAEAKTAIDHVHEATIPKNGGMTLRAQHAKATYATPDAKVKIAANLPKELQLGAFQPGAEMRAIVRLSNVRGTSQGDGEPDLRGIAIRLTDDKGKVHDILMNTTPMFFAPDAKTTLAGAESREAGAKGLLGLAGKAVFGGLDLGDTIGMVRGGLETRTKDISLASHTFWSRTPFKLGDHAVKFRLVPAEDTSSSLVAGHGDNQLKDDMEARLKKGPVKYHLQIQGFRDPVSTPMEDTRKVWDTPFITVAELTLPQTGPHSAEDEQRVKNEVEHMAFSPFHTWDDKFLEPLGEINAIRKGAYDESSSNRGVDPAKKLRCPLGFG